MANVKITDLNQDTAPASTDVLPFVDISSDETKKVTVEDLLESAGDGTAATPAFSFDNDKSVGMWRPGSEQLAFSTSGTTRLFIDASGNIGVGIASPQQFLHVHGTNGRIQITSTGTGSASGDGALFGYDGTNDLFINNRESTNFKVFTAGTQALTIDSSQRVGIGNTAPSAKLQIEGTSDQLKLTYPSIASYIHEVHSNGDYSVSKDSNERLRIDSSGNVGVGTTSPENYGSGFVTVEARGTSADGGGIFQTRSYDASVKSYYYCDSSTDTARIGTVTNHPFLFVTNTAERMRIDSSGNVGIGTTSPEGALEIDADGDGTQLIIKRKNAAQDNGLQLQDQTGGTIGFFNVEGTVSNRLQIGSSDEIAFHTSSSFGNPPSNEHMRLDTSGRLLVGTSSDSQTTTVLLKGNSSGAANAGTLRIERGQGAGSITSSGIELGTIALGGSAIPSAIVKAESDGNWTAGSSYPTRLKFLTTADGSSTPTARMTIDSSGRLLVGTSSSVGDDNNLQVVGSTADASAATFWRSSSDTGNPSINFVKTRGSVASPSIVSSGDTLGHIRFNGHDSVDHNSRAAEIKAQVDGTPGANDMPGRLVFSTTADGASSPTEALRISSGQDLLLSQSGSGFFVGTTTDGAYRIGRSSYAVSSGTLYIGNAAIQVSSDARLKENIEDTNLDALDAIGQISVKDFTWNDPTDTSANNRNARGKWTGLIAQELVEVLPFVVNAPRNENGEIDHDSENIWTLDQSQLCPVLIKAMQQQQAMIAELQAKVAALEAQ